MDLKSLRIKRGTLVEDCRRLLKTAETEKRSLSTEERTKYDTMFKASQDLAADITREEALREEERSMAEGSERVDRTKIDGEKGNRAGLEKIRPLLDAFFRGNKFTPQDDEQRSLQADLDVSGGFLKAPQEFISTLIKAVDDQLFIRRLATVHTITQSDSLGAASIDSDPSDAAWTSEIGTPTADTAMAIGKRDLKPTPLKKLLKVSKKLLAISPSASSIVRDRLAYKMALPQEKAFLTGNGANQPLGVFTASAAGISTGRDVATHNTGTEISAKNLIAVKGALKSQYRAKAQWVGHRDWETRVSMLVDSNGQFIWRPGLEAGQPDRLLGFPLNISENAPSTFTSGLYAAILGDFSNYWIADVLQMSFQRLDELFALSSQIGFIVEQHVDGMPVLEEAFVRSKMG